MKSNLKEESPTILCTYLIETNGKDKGTMSVQWVENQVVNREIYNELRTRGINALDALIYKIQLEAPTMLQSEGIRLGFGESLGIASYQFSGSEIKIINEAFKEKLVTSGWINICRPFAELISFCGKDAVPKVIEALNKSRTWIEKIEFIWILGQIGDKEAVRPLMKLASPVLSPFTESEVRSYAYNMLKAIQGKNYTPINPYQSKKELKLKRDVTLSTMSFMDKVLRMIRTGIFYGIVGGIIFSIFNFGNGFSTSSFGISILNCLIGGVIIGILLVPFGSFLGLIFSYYEKTTFQRRATLITLALVVYGGYQLAKLTMENGVKFIWQIF